MVKFKVDIDLRERVPKYSSILVDYKGRQLLMLNNCTEVENVI